jgi:hypothetical protein
MITIGLSFLSIDSDHGNSEDGYGLWTRTTKSTVMYLPLPLFSLIVTVIFGFVVKSAAVHMTFTPWSSLLLLFAIFFGVKLLVCCLFVCCCCHCQWLIIVFVCHCPDNCWILRITDLSPSNANVPVAILSFTKADLLSKITVTIFPCCWVSHHCQQCGCCHQCSCRNCQPNCYCWCCHCHLFCLFGSNLSSLAQS